MASSFSLSFQNTELRFSWLCLTLSISGVTGIGVPLPIFSLYNTCVMRKHPEKTGISNISLVFKILKDKFNFLVTTWHRSYRLTICHNFNGSHSWAGEEDCRAARTSAAGERLSVIHVIVPFLWAHCLPITWGSEMVRTRFCCYPSKIKTSVFF